MKGDFNECMADNIVAIWEEGWLQDLAFFNVMTDASPDTYEADLATVLNHFEQEVDTDHSLRTNKLFIYSGEPFSEGKFWDEQFESLPVVEKILSGITP